MVETWSQHVRSETHFPAAVMLSAKVAIRLCSEKKLTEDFQEGVLCLLHKLSYLWGHLGCSFLWGQLDTTNEKQTRGSSKAVRNVGRECWTYESSVYLLGVGRFLRSEVKYLRACCSLSLHYLYSSSLWTTLMLCWCSFCQTVLDLMIFALSNKSKRFTGSPVLESSF